MTAKKKPVAKKERITIDNKKLIQLIEAGTHQKDIMQQLGIKTSNQLRVAYSNALMESGMVPKIQGGRGGGAVSDEVVVGKRGSIVIPKNLVEKLQYVIGDRFTVKKTGTKISLVKK